MEVLGEVLDAIRSRARTQGITVALDGDRVILTGRVRSFYLKQLAQAEAAVRLVGHEIVNEIVVR